MPNAISDDDYSACGTNRGYTRHRRRPEPICEPCHEAHLAYQRAWYLANKARLKRQRIRAELSKAA